MTATIFSVLIMLKVWVDQETCIGCELCVSICPSVFKMKEDGKSESTDMNHPEANSPACVEAKDACPVAAIKIDSSEISKQVQTS